MIDVKKAIQAAKESLLALYSDTEIKDLLLEEVELTDDEKYWDVTLGFSVPSIAPSVTNRLSQSLEEFEPPKHERRYKLFKVDADDGEVKSMKIRWV